MDYASGLLGWNPEVRASNIFCSAPSALKQLPQLRDAKIADTDFDKFYLRFFREATIWRQFQERGTCAGQSGKNAWDYRKAGTGILYPHLVTDRYKASVAGGYGAGRVEIANQRGSWDGAACSWIAEAYLKYGALLLKDLNLPENNLKEDEALAVKWANSREGVPDNLEALMAPYKLEAIPPVHTMEELLLCNVNLIPVQTGSFTIPDGNVDSTGFCGCERHSGGHATIFGGVRNTASGQLKKMQFKYINSWKFWAFEGCCWISYDDARSIIEDGDSYAYT